MLGGTAQALSPGNCIDYPSFCFTRSQSGNSTIIATAAIPAGAYPPATFFPPITAGEMSMRTSGTGTLTADLYAGMLMTIDLTGSGGLSANGALIISMLCNMIGSGTLTANIVGLSNMTLALTGSGSLTANMSGFAEMVAALSGSGSLSTNIGAIGNMSVDMVVTGTGLSTANVGQAVWEYLAALSTDPNTMGGKLNAAGGAADPWGTLLPGAYTTGMAGKIIGDFLDRSVSDGSTQTSIDALQILIDELHKVQGLNASFPATTTPSNLTVDTINIDITGDGISSTTFTRND